MKLSLFIITLGMTVAAGTAHATPLPKNNDDSLRNLLQSTPYNQKAVTQEIMENERDPQAIFRSFIGTRPHYVTDVLNHLDMDEYENRQTLLKQLKQAPAAWDNVVHRFIGQQSKIALIEVLRAEAEAKLAQTHTDRIFAMTGPSGSDAIIISLGTPKTRSVALRVIASTKREELLSPVVRLLESKDISDLEKRACLKTIAKVGGEHASRTIDRFISNENPTMLAHALEAVLIIGETKKGKALRDFLRVQKSLRPMLIQALGLSDQPLTAAELNQQYIKGGMEEKHAVLEAAAQDDTPGHVRILVLASMEASPGLATKARNLLTASR